jgi:hypothetical protein
MASDGGLVGYDLTISAANAGFDHNVIGVALSRYFKKFVFQLEASETYVHYQFRGHLIKKKTVQAMIKIATENLWGAHVGATSTTVHAGNSFNYVMKADTKRDGPWTEEDFVLPPILTRQLAQFHTQEKYPWQTTVDKWCDELDDRAIKLVYDQIGNNGKSIFAEYLEYHGKAFEMPPFRLMEDIMACAMGIKPQKVYLIDMPRGMKKDKLGEFYSGLESLKNGVCYDKRYAFRKRRFDRPQIIVFTNTLPEMSFMSADRWSIWEMDQNKTLSQYEFFT